MFDDLELSTARVLVLDEKNHGRLQTRGAMFALGFRSIEDTSDIDLVAELLAERKVHLVVAGVQGLDDDVLEMVQNIRRRGDPGDPFVPIILNVWSTEENLVNQIISSGADDLLAWPFSVNQLGARVRTLINARKKFVATENYFGPDRRAAKGARGNGRGIDVPNALRAFTLKDRSALPSPEAIQRSMSAMLIEKIQHEVQAIEDYVKDLAPAVLARDETKLAGGILDLLRMLQSAMDSIARLGLDHLGELVAAVDHVLGLMKADISSINDRQGMLLRKTTRALTMAVSMDKSVAAMARGISAEINEAGQRKAGALAGPAIQKAVSNYL